MCDPIGFEPDLGRMKLPPGYALDGIQGMDGPPRYHWTMKPDEDDSATWRFGPNELTRRAAVRQAWRDFRCGGTDPEVIDGPALAQPYR